jgi:hypothetical protein
MINDLKVNDILSIETYGGDYIYGVVLKREHISGLGADIIECFMFQAGTIRFFYSDTENPEIYNKVA